jgi:hypothetical protein
MSKLAPPAREMGFTAHTDGTGDDDDDDVLGTASRIYF